MKAMTCNEEVGPSDRDVFEEFGILVHNIQAFEYTLANLLGQVYSDGPTKLTQSQVVDLLHEHYGKTLGNLRRDLMKAIGESHPLVDSVREAVDLRRFFIHHYFRERVEAMKTPEGRRQMILEIEEAQRDFMIRDNQLMEVYFNWLRTNGAEEGAGEREDR